MAKICCICMPCHVSFLCVPHHDTLADSLLFAFVCRLGGVTIADPAHPVTRARILVWIPCVSRACMHLRTRASFDRVWSVVCSLSELVLNMSP